MPGRVIIALGVIVLAVAFPAAAAPRQTLATYCKVPSVKGDLIHFDGLTGAVVGGGNVGIVLANTSDGHICDWVLDDSALMGDFAKNGYRVLLFEWHGTTEAAEAKETAAAAVELRELGSPTIVLGGASIGGVTALEAAATLKPAPAAVFGFSSSTDNPAAATAAVHRLKLPLLFVAARDDPYASSTRSLYRDATTRTKQLILVPGQTHGFFDLNPSAEKVDAAVLAFIAEHT
jgi:pimeloyl-ACP methyl ester carboxylesterase